MPFDYFAIKALSEELQERLLGSQITQALLVGDHDLWLETDRSQWLLTSASPHFSRVLLSSGPPGEGERLGDQLSKYLLGALIDEISPDETDRIIRLRLSRQDRIGTRKESVLIAELMDRNSNVILVDEGTGKVVGALRKVTPKMSRYRQISPGIEYLPPPPQDRVLPSKSSLGEFKKYLLKPPQKALIDALTKTLVGAGKLTAQEIAFRAGLDSQTEVCQLDDSALASLWETALSLYRCPPLLDGRALIIVDGKGGIYDFSVLDLTSIPEERKQFCPTVSETIERFFQFRIESHERELLRRETLSVLKREITSIERKLERLKEDLKEAQNADLFQKKAHILMANLRKVPRWVERVELENFYSYDPNSVQGMSKISIDLDPSLSPLQNAQRYLTRYRKARSGEGIIKDRFASTQKLLDHLSEYRRIASSVTERKNLISLRDKLVAEGLIKTKRLEERAKSDKKGMSINPRRYITSDGWTVLVGRNNAENDALTHRLAARDDLWFHADGCPGSHVILRREGRKSEPSRRALEEAAALAAYWSKARGSKTVPVIYTLVKYVIKPKRAKPGLAKVRQEKTLFVEPRLIRQASSQPACG